jgi:hypothetical protein
MRNRSFSPCSFGRFFDFPLRSGALSSSLEKNPPSLLDH